MCLVSTMYRYVVSLFLLYTCCFSLPAPKYDLLSKPLTELANSCENQVISDLIKSKVEECNVAAPKDKKGYKEKQLECLMFYDMNNQLCSAVSSFKLTIKDPDIKSKINDVQDVNKLCSIVAPTWNFGMLTNYPHYQGTAKKALGNLLLCLKVCMSKTDDIDEKDVTDSKFFCKFYKWGSELLNSQVTLSGSAPSQSEIMPLPAGTTSNNTSDKDNQDIEVKIPVSSTDNKPQLELEKPVVENNLQSELETDKKIGIPVEEKGVDNHLATQSKTNGPTNNDEKLSMDGEEPPKKEDVEKEQAQEAEDKKRVVIENPKIKQSPDTDVYQGGDLDSEEEKEGLDTQGGDDGDDPMLLDVDVKPNHDQGKQSVKRIETSVSIYNGDTPKEFLPNPIPDGFADDDDHFFPFFLTAVILVVLIYVLYHNKSKVSKLFLGLIVEGRQPGRRRNSRGHAYRRLDTLEQAMSANTAAPPSKIIY